MVIKSKNMPAHRRSELRGSGHFRVVLMALVAWGFIFSNAGWSIDSPLVEQMGQSEPVDQPEEPRSRPALDLTALDRPIDPETYLIGPGDELAINIWGGVHHGYTITVSPEATAILPTVGEISLRGLTLKQAKRKILSRTNQVYPRVPSTVTLVQVRSLKVAVTGEVSRPGMYLVTANVRACEVIEHAGWLASSSRRRAVLARGSDSLRIDALLFNHAGDQRYNPYLTEGDLIFVPRARQGHGVFDIHGAVNYPGSYEFIPGDRLAEVIKLSRGFTVVADTTVVELVRFVGDDTITVTYNLNLAVGPAEKGRLLQLQADDRIFVREIKDYRPKAAIVVRGEVVRPGRYIIENDQVVLSRILMLCGGPTARADLSRATLVRGDHFLLDQETDTRMRSIPGELQTKTEREWVLAYSLSAKGQVSLDLRKLIIDGDLNYDLHVLDGDVLYIPRFLPQINVIGRVVRPGVVPYEPGRDLAYYLGRAGGPSWRADKQGIFVVKGNTGMPVNKKKIKKLEAGDTIVIPTIREKKFWPVFRDALVVLGNMATLYLVIDQTTR